MAADIRTNKNSASEDELGEIHNLTTKLHSLRLKQMIELNANSKDISSL